MPEKPHTPRCNRCRKPMLNPVDVAAGRCVECRRAAALAAASPKPSPSAGPGAEWESLIGEGIELVQAEKRNLWAQGDLAVRVLIGRKSEALEEFTLRIGADYETFQEYRRIAIAFPPESRRLSLSFTHHKAVATREDRHEWIARAAAEKWSRPQMLDSIKAQIRPIPTLVGIESETPNDIPSTITNHDTVFVSEQEAVNDLLERVPDLMETPLAALEKDLSWEQVEDHAVAEIQKLARYFWDETDQRPEPGETVVDTAIRLLRG